ncbi:hypothetical protein KIPB_011174, partial [Kipferlia bialata]
SLDSTALRPRWDRDSAPIKQEVEVDVEWGQGQRVEAGGDAPSSATWPQWLIAPDKLETRFRGLCHLVKRDSAAFETQPNAGGIRRFNTHASSSLPVTVYNNGILIRRGPFRAYASDPSAIAFAKSVAKGYFPDELQKLYPDGVVFDYKVMDVAYCDTTTSRPAFGGAGHSLESPTKAGPVTTSTSTSTEAPAPRYSSSSGSGSGHSVGTNVVSVHTVDEERARGREASLSVVDFLARLPHTIVQRQGRLVPIRSSVADILGVGQEETRTPAADVAAPPSPTPAPITSMPSSTPSVPDTASPGGADTPSGLAVIRVSVPDAATRTRFVLRLEASCPLSEVYTQVARRLKCPSVELMAPLMSPPLADRDAGSSLHSLGLCPTAHLIARQAE